MGETDCTVVWEYRLISYELGDRAERLAMLNEAGAEGWEVIQVGRYGAWAKRPHVNVGTPTSSFEVPRDPEEGGW